MNKPQYQKVLKYLQGFFPQNKIPADTFKAWYIVFEPLVYEAVLLRVLDATENEKFFPYPNYFRNEVYKGYLFFIKERCMSDGMKINLQRIKEAVEL